MLLDAEFSCVPDLLLPQVFFTLFFPFVSCRCWLLVLQILGSVPFAWLGSVCLQHLHSTGGCSVGMPCGQSGNCAYFSSFLLVSGYRDFNRKWSVCFHCTVTGFFTGISGKRKYCMYPYINVLTDEPVFWYKMVFCDL